MIRLLLNKTVLSSTLSIIRNTPKVQQLPKQFAIRCFSTKTLSSPVNQSNSGLAKDILVYKYENPRFFMIMNVFAISQFLFWGNFQ